MKHLGVKTRAVDSKKSRGGFFKRAKVSVHGLRHSKEHFEACFELFAAFELFLQPAIVLLSFQNRKEESAKAKPRGVFPSIPSWIAGNSMYPT